MGVLKQAPQQLDAVFYVVGRHHDEVGDHLLVRRPVVAAVELRDLVPERRGVAAERVEQQVLVQVGQSGFERVLRERPVAHGDEHRGEGHGSVLGDHHFQPVLERGAVDEPIEAGLLGGAGEW